MQIVYLGLFAKIFDWVFNAILSPVTNFISKLLSKVLGWVFTNVLVPVLNFVIENFLEIWIIELKILFSQLLLKVTTAILVLIDLMERAMNYFIGISNVTYKGDEMTILEAFLSFPQIRNAFIAITVLGLSLALVFTIISVGKSTLDFDFENKRPVSAVLSSFMKSCVTFLMVPLLSLFIIKLSAIILSVINDVMKVSSGASLASSVFYCMIQNALGPEGEATALKYLNNVDDFCYWNTAKVYGLPFWNFDYISGIIVSLFLLVIMISVIVVFVKRIFEILILYLASPLFVSTIPLDDGEKFGKWRELFVGKIFTGYGSIMAMKLYVMIAPLVMARDTITFPSLSENAFNSSGELTYIVKLIFLVGGAFTMLKAGSMVTSIISFAAGQDERSTTMAAQGMTTHMAMKVGNQAFGMIKNGLNKPATPKNKWEKGVKPAAGTPRKGVEKGIMLGGHRTPQAVATRKRLNALETKSAASQKKSAVPSRRNSVSIGDVSRKAGIAGAAATGSAWVRATSKSSDKALGHSVTGSAASTSSFGGTDKVSLESSSRLSSKLEGASTFGVTDRKIEIDSKRDSTVSALDLAGTTPKLRTYSASSLKSVGSMKSQTQTAARPVPTGYPSSVVYGHTSTASAHTSSVSSQTASAASQTATVRQRSYSSSYVSSVKSSGALHTGKFGSKDAGSSSGSSSSAFSTKR